MLSHYYARNYVRSKKECEEMIKIDLDLFMACCFIWAYFRDCRRTNELGIKISWLEEKLRWH